MQFNVNFAIEHAKPDHQYIGYANVAIENLEEKARNGFILSEKVFEEANLAYQTYSSGEVKRARRSPAVARSSK